MNDTTSGTLDPRLPRIPVDVLVLGGGFAGVWCAKQLERSLPRTATVQLVSAENYFVFQPLLPEVVGASVDPSHVISPLRHLLKRTRIVRGEVTRIVVRDGGADGADVEVTTPDTTDRTVYAAKHLVLALGSIVDVSRIPGMAEHALLMKNLADALQLRLAVVARLERAVLEPDPHERRALLSFVVIGAGLTGVETAAEMLDLLKSARKVYPTLQDERFEVICLEGNDRIMGEFDQRLGEYARELLTARGMQVLLNARCRAVSAEGVYLADGRFLEAKTIVCTVGNAPHPVLKDLAVARERGRIRTDAFLRVEGHTTVWAVGDCAYVPDGHGGIAPPTAQFAIRQGTQLGRNVAAAFLGKGLTRFRHRSEGQLASLGHNRAVAYIRGFRFAGFFAWWLWRTIYLLKLPRLDRKLRVVLDWTLRLAFPRDLTFVDVRRTQPLSSVHLEDGEILFRQGDPSAAFYVVKEGTMELTLHDRDGAVLRRDRLGPGEHFGEGSLLRNRIRRTTARAVGGATVLVFAARDFDAMLGAFTAFRTLLTNTSRRFLSSGELESAGLPRELAAMPVEALMSRPVVTLPPETTFETALRRMTERPISSFPIATADGRLLAMITRNELYASLRADLDLGAPLLSIARTDVVTVLPTDSVGLAVEHMRRRGLQHVPVVDAQRCVVGMLSMRDVVARILAARSGAATN